MIDGDAAVAHQLGVAEQHGSAVDASADAVAGDGGKVLRIGERDLARLGALDDRLAERVLGAALERRRQPQHRRLVAALGATTSVSAGSPRVIVPVLSSMMASSFSALCSASPERIRMPFSAPLPMPTVSDVGVARPSAHGQAMISVVTRTMVA